MKIQSKITCSLASLEFEASWRQAAATIKEHDFCLPRVTKSEGHNAANCN